MPLSKKAQWRLRRIFHELRWCMFLPSSRCETVHVLQKWSIGERCSTLNKQNITVCVPCQISTPCNHMQAGTIHSSHLWMKKSAPRSLHHLHLPLPSLWMLRRRSSTNALTKIHETNPSSDFLLYNSLSFSSKVKVEGNVSRSAHANQKIASIVTSLDISSSSYRPELMLGDRCVAGLSSTSVYYCPVSYCKTPESQDRFHLRNIRVFVKEALLNFWFRYCRCHPRKMIFGKLFSVIYSKIDYFLVQIICARPTYHQLQDECKLPWCLALRASLVEYTESWKGSRKELPE